MARAKNLHHRENINNMITKHEEYDVYTFITFDSPTMCINFMKIQARFQFLLISYRLTLSLARQVFLFYSLSLFFTYIPHISFHIFYICIQQPLHFLVPMPPKRTTRSSARSQSKGSNKANATSSRSKPRTTKTQMNKQRKAVRERKASIQRSQDELKALKKKHAEEQKAMEKMIKVAQNNHLLCKINFT